MKPQSRLPRIIISAVFLIGIAPTIGHAWSCVTFGPCDPAWKRGEVVFLGTVTAKEAFQRADAYGRYNVSGRLSGRIAVHFSVTEVFNGHFASEKDTIVFTGTGGGDNGYPFVVGQSYLVYASSNQGQLTTSICMQTRPAVMAHALMRQLRATSNKSERATLFGMIGIRPRGNGWEELIESKALAGVHVRAIGSAGPEYSATSDEQGVYSFEWLPSDSYRLEVDLLKGLSTWKEEIGEPLMIPIGNTEETRGCSVDVFARPAGRISGVVLDAKDKPVAGFVTIISADPADRRRGGLPGFTTDDGNFRLLQVPPGRYQLIFYPELNGQISFRFQFRSEAFDVAFGQQIENFQFNINHAQQIERFQFKVNQ